VTTPTPAALRWTGLVLLLAAAWGYAVAVVPLHRERAPLQDAFARAREDRQRARLRVADLERRLRVRTSASLPVAEGVDSVGPLRRAVLDVLDAAQISDVSLAVQPGRAPVAATVRLTAKGRFADLVPLTGRLVAGPPGLVLGQLRLQAADGRLVADLEGFRLEGAAP
jgi:hypothetical protein